MTLLSSMENVECECLNDFFLIMIITGVVGKEVMMLIFLL
jgi:hypothetical protein